MEPFKLSSLPPHAAVYFIGIGGISMNGIAEMLMRRGYSVSGSDREETPITRHLSSLGATITIGQKYENIHPSYSLVVYTGAIHDDNPELVHARELGIPCVERPILLGMLLEEYQKMCIRDRFLDTPLKELIPTKKDLFFSTFKLDLYHIANNFDTFLEAVGAEHIVIGSNAPFAYMEPQFLRLLNSKKATEADLVKIYGANIKPYLNL